MKQFNGQSTNSQLLLDKNILDAQDLFFLGSIFVTAGISLTLFSALFF